MLQTVGKSMRKPVLAAALGAIALGGVITAATPAVARGFGGGGGHGGGAYHGGGGYRGGYGGYRGGGGYYRGGYGGWGWGAGLAGVAIGAAIAGDPYYYPPYYAAPPYPYPYYPRYYRWHRAYAPYYGWGWRR